MSINGGRPEEVAERVLYRNQLVEDTRSDRTYALTGPVRLDVRRAIYCPYCDRPLTRFEQVALSRCIGCLNRP